MTKPARLSGLMVLLGVALPACGEGAEEPASASRSAGERRTAAGSTPAGAALSSNRRAGTKTARKRRRPPSIDIVRPVDGQRIRGDQVTVKVKVKNFRIVEQRVRPPFPPPVAGRGHVHFYLDTKRLPTRHGPPETGAYRSVSTTTYTWVGVPPGRHSLAVQLVGKDHAPLRPQAKDRITVEVK